MLDRNLLLSIMARQGYSQSKLAEEIGLSKNTVSDMMNGKRFPRTDEVESICVVLGITDKRLKADIFLNTPSQ